MAENLTFKKYLSLDEQLHMLKAFECLLSTDFDSQDKNEIEKAVDVLLKNKSDVGIIVTGLKPTLERLVRNAYASKNYKAAKSAITLLRMSHYGHSRDFN